MKVGYFPYRPGGNPYQALFASALESAGMEVLRLPPEKWFPLQRVSRVEADILQFDWPHDWYRGKNRMTALMKKVMYEDGLRRLKRQPVVWTAHNLVAHDADDAEFERRMIQKLIDVADGIIVLSSLSEKALRDMYCIHSNTVVKVIHHGHYIDEYPNEIQKHDALRKLGIDEGKKVVLHLGRLLPYKGIEELIASFETLNDSECHLVVAGSGASKEFSEKLLQLAGCCRSKGLSITLHSGFISDDDLQNYFAAADVVALPFKNILNSGSLLLAMSFGKCVVAPDTGSIREIACDAGWFGYHQDSPDGLSDALKQALQATDLVEREEAVLRFTTENYSWSKTGHLAKELYNKVLAR